MTFRLSVHFEPPGSRAKITVSCIGKSLQPREEICFVSSQYHLRWGFSNSVSAEKGGHFLKVTLSFAYDLELPSLPKYSHHESLFQIGLSMSKAVLFKS